jgi:hypothetical protein
MSKIDKKKRILLQKLAFVLKNETKKLEFMNFL